MEKPLNLLSNADCYTFLQSTCNKDPQNHPASPADFAENH
jgi:hypothetical protein